MTQVDWWVRQRDGASKSSSNTSVRTNSSTTRHRSSSSGRRPEGRSERIRGGPTEDGERRGQGGVSEVHDPKRRDTAAGNLHNNQPRAGSNFGGAGKRMRLNWKRMADGISVDGLTAGGGGWFGFMGGRMGAFRCGPKADTSTPGYRSHRPPVRNQIE